MAHQSLRCALTVAKFGAIGAGLTVIIAAVGAILPGPPIGDGTVRVPVRENRAVPLGTIVTRWASTRVGWSGETEALSQSLSETPPEPATAPPHLPPWCTPVDQRLAQLTAAGRSREAGEIACGWPLRAFTARWEVSRTGLYVGAIVNVQHGFLGPGRGSQRTVIPYSPIWTGLLGNITALGASAAGLAWLARSAVRLRRRRSGRCESCGYEVGTLDACPECGRGRARRVQ